MEARSIEKKTPKLSKSYINEIIGKKCANVANYKSPEEKRRITEVVANVVLAEQDIRAN